MGIFPDWQRHFECVEISQFVLLKYHKVSYCNNLKTERFSTVLR